MNTQHPILGKKVRDQITNLIGTVTQRVESLYGSPRCEVTYGLTAEGREIEPKWVEEARLEVVD